MKTILLTIVLVTCFVAIMGQCPINDSSWNTTTLTLEDHFTNPATFSNLWNSGAYNNNSLIHCDTTPEASKCERQAYLAANIIYNSGGGLSLKSAKQNIYIRADKYPADNTIMCDGNQNLRWFEYTSGAITTILQYSYGYYEIRCKIPKGLGYWPAFWMHMNDQEIDVVEPSGAQSEFCTQYTANVYQPDNCPLDECKSPGKVWSSTDLSLLFHKYAVEWSPGLVIFYLDDVPVRTVTGNIVPNIPMHVMANLAISPWWTIPPPFSAKSLDIEYIKIYSLKKNCTEEVIASNFNFATHNYSLKKLYRLSNTTVPTNTHYTIRATDEITFNPGFEAQVGADFTALVIPCY